MGFEVQKNIKVRLVSVCSDKFKDHVEGSMTTESVIFCFSPNNYHTVGLKHLNGQATC